VKITKAEAQARIWERINQCWSETADMVFDSVEESDKYWEMSEDIMQILAEHRGMEEPPRATEAEPDEKNKNGLAIHLDDYEPWQGW